MCGQNVGRSIKFCASLGKQSANSSRLIFKNGHSSPFVGVSDGQPSFVPVGLSLPAPDADAHGSQSLEEDD